MKWLFFLIVALSFAHKLKKPSFKDASTSFVDPAQGNMELPSLTELIPRKYDPLPLGSIKPEGWLRRQLQIQANGLAGNLDHIWADIAFSQWVGGSAEGWERGPYWLDGMTALAYSLDEEWLKEKVTYWFNYILAHQQPDGMYGPVVPNGNLGQGHNPSNDSWPASLVLKAMTQYYEATHDPRIIPSMEKFFHFLDDLTKTKPLFSWGAYRWQDLQLSIYWLHEKTKEPYLLNLANRVYSQGYNWTRYYQTFPCKVKFTADACGDWMASHGVNVAQGLKAPAMTYRMTGSETDKNGIKIFLSKLDEFHGTSSGIFAADELLAGLMPSQGSETCQVVEDMFSLETSFAIIGDLNLIDRLEMIAFNAMPASNSPDMWEHQYVQQANQVQAIFSDDRVYVNDGPEANMFGIAPNYGCCTANYPQGWPKYVSHMWMVTSDQLVAVSHGPSMVKATIRGVEISVNATTAYPFEDLIRYEITMSRASDVSLCMRIPSWTMGAIFQVEKIVLDGKNGTLLCTSHTWNEGITIASLKLPLSVRSSLRYNDAVSIYYGPILMSLHIGQDWFGVDEEKLLFEVHPTSSWQYALDVDPHHIEKGIDIVHAGVNVDCPFCPETPAFVGKVMGRSIDWPIQHNAASPPPRSPISSASKSIPLTMVPYGNAPLRLTELPWIAS